MYEEESHYYIDVLCDDFCVMADDNQIVYVEDSQAPIDYTLPDTDNGTIKEVSATMEESTLETPDK